jgi:hypothetical protein
MFLFTFIPTYPSGKRGESNGHLSPLSNGVSVITLVATEIKSMPVVLDTNGNEREARRLVSITCQHLAKAQYEFTRFHLALVVSF